MIGKIKAEQVRASFLESSINPKLAQQIGTEAGVTVVDTRTATRWAIRGRRARPTRA